MHRYGVAILIALAAGSMTRADIIDVDVHHGSFITRSDVPGQGTNHATIQVGDTVRWTWIGFFHSVTADDGAFNSGIHDPPFVFTHTFDSAGDFGFYCMVHGAPGGLGMSGVIEVEGGAPPCPGDVDGDGTVGLSDLATLLSNFGAAGEEPVPGDLDGDFDVDLTDLATLLGNFGATCP